MCAVLFAVAVLLFGNSTGLEWVATTRDVTEKRFQSVLGGRPSRGTPDTTLAAAHSLLILRSPETAWCAPVFGRSATRHTPSSGGGAFMSIASASCASGQMPFGAPAPTIRPQQFLHRPPEPHSSLLNSTQPDVAQLTEPHRICRASDDGTDAESSGSKQGPPQAATAPRMISLQDSRLAVPGPEIDVSACEHRSRAAGPLKSHSACRRQGAAV